MQAFYGGDPAAWFRLPMVKLRAYMAAMPRIEAMQQLRSVEAVTAGTSGQMKPQDRRQYVGELKRRSGARQKAKKATRGDLAALGIPVKEV